MCVDLENCGTSLAKFVLASEEKNIRRVEASGFLKVFFSRLKIVV
jgi:hypothetical protein